MKQKTIENAAYHEAGHAVVAIRNGYKILNIELQKDEITGGWSGCVNYDAQAWNCETCGHVFGSRHDVSQLRDLKDSCASCKGEKFKFIQRCLAGGAATVELLADQHDSADSECDRTLVGQLYPSISDGRVEAFCQGALEAKEIINQNKDAIARLVELLISKAPSMGSFIEVSAADVQEVVGDIKVS